LQATVAQALRRAVAIAVALSEQVAQRSGLADLKRQNAAGSLTPDGRADFAELSTAEALVTLHVLGAALSVLLAPHAGGEAVEIGSLEEILTENAPSRCKARLGAGSGPRPLATSEERLVGTTLAFAEALMARVASRGGGGAGARGFHTGRAGGVAADDLTVQGFSPPRRGAGRRFR
jgi:hypothetical protein